MDDFESLAVWGLWADNGGWISIYPDTGAVGQGIKIEAGTVSTWSWWFAKRDIASDWRSLGRVCFSYRKTTDSCNLAVALKDGDGEIWYREVSGEVRPDWTRTCVLFADLQLDPYDVQGNGVLDLSWVREFRFRHVPQSVCTVNWDADDLQVCP